MDAFLFYIDDWLSSRKVEEMDQLEELAYFRLLVYAAKEPDCGLPKDPRRLAKWSRLGAQWGKLTRDPDFQFDNTTSGEKILACFEIEKDGRIYNKRLLQTFTKYQASLEQRKAAANRRWGKSIPAPATESATTADANADANAYPPDGPLAPESHNASHSVRNATRVGDGNGNGNVLESTKTEEQTKNSKLAVIPFPSNFTNQDLNPFRIFEEIWLAYPEAGRSRKEMSRGVFFGILDQFKGKELELLDTILAGLTAWRQSDLWTRGAVHGIRNWLSERLWIETPPPPQRLERQQQSAVASGPQYREL